MNDPNPYSAPETEVLTQPQGDTQFGDLDFKQFKKLYYRSCNVNAITFLIGLGLVVIVVAALAQEAADGIIRAALLGIAAFYAVTVIGLFKRTSWGRILGIIVCMISLLSIPVGTAIGAFGLFAFFGAPQLFGAGRTTHASLKAEFKLRKTIQKMGGSLA